MLVLRDEKTAFERRELTVYAHEGGIRVDGWELGDVTERVHGDREYEWTIDVAEHDLPALVTALGGAPGEDVFDAIRRTCSADPDRLQQVIMGANIPHAWWHRLGD